MTHESLLAIFPLRIFVYGDSSYYHRLLSALYCLNSLSSRILLDSETFRAQACFRLPWSFLVASPISNPRAREFAWAASVYSKVGGISTLGCIAQRRTLTKRLEAIYCTLVQYGKSACTKSG